MGERAHDHVEHPLDIGEASTSPSAKVTFIDAEDPWIQHRALFNPESIAPAGSVEIGQLHPIGWSAPVQQYAYTNDINFSLELKYSWLAMKQRGITFVDHREAYAFFFSYLYGPRPGIAPANLIVVFPKTLTMRVAVKSVAVNFERWDTSMNVRAFSINLDLTEIAESFRTNKAVRRSGLQIATRDIGGGAGAAVKAAGGQGARLNTGSGSPGGGGTGGRGSGGRGSGGSVLT
jgi:hypothetical protein